LFFLVEKNGKIREEKNSDEVKIIVERERKKMREEAER